MDLVAALAFSVVIVQMFKLNGVNDHKTLVKSVISRVNLSAIISNYLLSLSRRFYHTSWFQKWY